MRAPSVQRHWGLVGRYVLHEELERLCAAGRTPFVTAHGLQTSRALLERAPKTGRVDEVFFAEMRHAAWQLRARSTEVAFPVAALAAFYAGVHYLHAKGAKLADIEAFVLCSLASCTCDGCQWRSGRGFDVFGR